MFGRGVRGVLLLAPCKASSRKIPSRRDAPLAGLLTQHEGLYCGGFQWGSAADSPSYCGHSAARNFISFGQYNCTTYIKRGKTSFSLHFLYLLRKYAPFGGVMAAVARLKFLLSLNLPCPHFILYVATRHLWHRRWWRFDFYTYGKSRTGSWF